MDSLILVIASKLFLLIHYSSKARITNINSLIIILGYLMLFVNYIQQYNLKKKKERHELKYEVEHELEQSNEMKETLGYSLLFIYYLISVIYYNDKIHIYDYCALIGFGYGIVRRVAHTNNSFLEFLPLMIFYSLYSYTHLEKKELLSGIGGMLSSIFYISQLIK
jgi:hypothetical protein